MKIIVVSNTTLTIRNFRVGLMRALKRKGHDVVFCAQDNGYAAEVSSQGFVYLPIAIDRKGTNFISDLGLVLTLYKLYVSQRPDIILHYTIKPNIYGSIAARIAGIPCVNTITGLGYIFIKKSAVYYLVKCLYKISCSFAKITFFQNKDDMGLFLKKGLINKNRAVLVNGSGVDPDFFNPDFCRTTNKKETPFVFLFTGRILRDKGIGELIDAARLTKKRYPAVQFWLAGIIDPGNPSGISVDMVRSWENEGLITYHGEVQDVRPFICRADCVVLPSYREGIPRSLLEALAMEKPVITTNTSGCKDVVEDGVNGFIVPVKDPMALFDAFRRMLELPPEIRSRMGTAGRAKVKKDFEECAVIDAYMAEIQKVVH